MTYQPVQDYPERHGVKGWHIAAVGAAVCLIGGTILTTEVCKPAPTVSSTAPSKGVLDQIGDALPTGLPTVPEAPPLPWDQPTTTRAPRTTTTTTSAPSRYDVRFSDSYSFGEEDAHKRCGVDVGRMLNLSATQAACLINSGQYVARGDAPPGSIKPGVKANAAGQVCTKEKPVWYWLGFPLALLALFLAWTSFSASRRDDAAHFDTGGFAGAPDLPPPPPPPSFGGAPTGVQQPATPTAPRSAPTHHYDDFGDEDF